MGLLTPLRSATSSSDRVLTEPTVVVAASELLASFPKTQQHISVLDLMIGLTDGLQFELSQGLECLDAPSGNDGGAGGISVRRSPIDFRLGIGVPDRQDDDVPFAIIHNSFRWRVNAQGARRQGLEFAG